MGDVDGRKILVGIDGSSAAQRAVRWAAREAATRHARLELVFVCDWAGRPARRAPAIRFRDRMAHGAQDFLRQAAEEARDAAPGLEVGTELVAGQPTALLTSRSAEVELVVLGNRGMGGLAGVLTGSVAVGVVSHARCPVVVVRAGEQQASVPDAASSRPVLVVRADLPQEPNEDPDANKTVLVGVDGSPDCEAAVAFAFDHAALHNRPLLAVHASHGAVLEPGSAAASGRSATRHAGARLLSEQLAGWQEKYPDVSVRGVVHDDRPAVVLTEHGRDAGLLVVGARGRGGMAGLLLGSTSQTLIHRAGCPIAVVRARGRS